MRSQAQIKQTLIDLLPPGAEDLYALGNQDGIGGTLNALAGAPKETLSDRIDQLRAEVNPSTELDEGFFRTLASNGTNRCDLSVFGHEEQILVVARLDNLGKGASGAAVQCMNLMLGFDEAAGLVA